MENTHKRQNKKKNRKPLYILGGFLLFFAIFIYAITRPSLQSKAMKEIDSSFNKKDVEMVWYKYKVELFQDEEFLFATRQKLTSFNLSQDDINECRGWLPPPPTSINVIIVPDLSRRIIDTVANPEQIKNDIFVLETVWKSFVEFSKLKQDTNDKLIVDVTDVDQAKGQFVQVADSLQFDLSEHKGKSNRLFFTDEKSKQFKNNIERMYKLAKEKPLGADYRLYVRRYLVNHIKKSTLFTNIKNKVIIVTDGYLEAENKSADTRLKGFEKQLRNSVSSGNTLQVITKLKLNIPNDNIDLVETDVLVCEVNERITGKGYDFEILKTYWDDWFTRMNAKITFIQREQANAITGKKISEFIMK